MEEVYKPSVEFDFDTLQPLVDFDLTDSKELWLIQCSVNQFPQIDGGELKIKHNRDEEWGVFEDSSGKSYDLVNFSAQEVDAAVIVPSGAQSKIVGKISRRVSLVCCPEPDELIEALNAKTHQKYTAGALTNSLNPFSTPAQTNRTRSWQSALRHPASTHSSRHRSILSGVGVKPLAAKREHSESDGRSHLMGSSGRAHISNTAFLGSSGRSGKTRKKMKIQE